MTTHSNVLALTDSLTGLGAELRELRKARGLTLKALSEAARISLSHLSAIERETSKPSLDVLYALAEALGVAPDWFIARRSGFGPLERAHVVRAQNRRDLNTLYGQGAEQLGYSDRLLSSSIGGAFYMGIATYEPHSETPNTRLQQHTGEQHGLVLEGELDLHLGDEVIKLRVGDSYSFDARIPHRARNSTSKISRLVWAVAPVFFPKPVNETDNPAATEPST